MNYILKITILSVSLITVMSTNGIAPAIGAMSNYFSTVSEDVIKMSLTLPALAVIPCSLLSGTLVKRFNKKNIVLVGLFFYIIGGLGAGLATSIGQLLFLRLILGIGVGLIMPLATGLIADFYVGHERAKLMGVSSAVNSIGSVLATLGSGFLCVMSWRYSFIIYGLSLIVLVLVMFYLPKDKLNPIEVDSDDQENNLSQLFTMPFMGFCVSIFVVMLSYYTISTDMSLYFQGNNLGDGRAAGFAISLLSIAAFLMGMVFNLVLKVLKHNLLPVSFSFFCIGFAIIAFTHTFWACCLGIFITGTGFGLLMPWLMLNISNVVPPQYVTLALAISTCFSYLGQTLSPMVIGGVKDLFGISGYAGSFFVASMICAIAVLSSAIVMNISARRSKIVEPTVVMEQNS